MCGASICQDRRFLSRAMPELAAFFHYRNLDVSSVKILGGLWQPEALEGVEKDGRHRAKTDILASIAELRHYRADNVSLKLKLKLKRRIARLPRKSQPPRPPSAHVDLSTI